MYDRVAVIHNSTRVFVRYVLPYEETVIFELISEKIDNITNQFPSVRIYICGDFNTHHKNS